MKKFIHKIRQQPEEVRRRILHTITISFGVVLLLLWIYSLGVNISSPETQSKMANDLKPLTNLKDSMVGGYNNL